MAKKKQPSNEKLEDVADAVIVNTDGEEAETPETAHSEDTADTAKTGDERKRVKDAPSDDARAPEGDDQSDKAEDATDADSTVEDTPQDDTPVPEDTPEQEEVADPMVADAPAAAAETVVVQKGGFFPMLLGGVIAAGVGFGAAYAINPEGWPWMQGRDNAALTDLTQVNAAQDARLDKLTSDIGTLSADQKSSDFEAQINKTQSAVDALSSQLATVSDQQAALETRLTDLEKQPIEQGASKAAVAAYEAELKKMQDAIAAQRQELEQMVATAQAKETAAQETAQAAIRRAAIRRIQSALDSGAGFGGAISDLEQTGVTVPAALSAVSSGVPTIAELAAAYSAPARDALRISRKAQSDSGEESGLGSFLKTQLGVRSLTPQEGDSADAVLSRAEAALRDRRLGDALAEIQALPDAGRAALADWVKLAQERHDAVSAAETLGQSLTAN